MLTTSPIFPFVFLLGLTGIAISIALFGYSLGVLSTNSLSEYGVTEELDGFFATIIWSFSLILDTGTFTENLGVSPRLLAFAAINSVFGLIITSAIIGNMVNLMQKGLDEMKRGGISVKEVDHLIILGWSRNAIHVLNVFAELGFSKRVVIMTPLDLNIVRGQLSRAKKKLRGIKPLLLQGRTTSNEDLERVAAGQASNVIFLADESLGNGMSQDAATIKGMMHLHGLIDAKKKPSFASEITSLSNLPIAQTASRNQYPIITSTEFISKAIAQAVRYVGYGAVYRELFSLKNNRFTIFNLGKQTEGRLFGDVAQGFKNGIPLGLTWLNDDGRRVAALNPEPDFDLADGDEIIVLVRGSESIRYEEVEPKNVNIGEPPTSDRSNLQKILIIGWNDHVPDTVKELQAHCLQGLSITVASTVDSETVLGEIHERTGMSSGLDINTGLLLEKDTQALSNLNPHQYDVIIQMADQTNPDFDADAKSAINMFLLSEVKSNNNLKFPPVIAEFLEEDNIQLCDGTPLSDSIISPQYLSVLLAHLSNEPILDSIFRELLSAGGVEIALRPVAQFTDRKSIFFSDLGIIVRSFNETALGYRIGGIGGELILNPSTERVLDLTSTVDIVVLAQQIYT